MQTLIGYDDLAFRLVLVNNAKKVTHSRVCELILPAVDVEKFSISQKSLIDKSNLFHELLQRFAIALATKP